MTIKVFQIDPVPVLAPYTYEKEVIRNAGGEMIIGDCNTPEDVLAQAGDAEVLLLSWKNIVPPAVMDALPNVRLIIRWGVGYDQIDVAAATARGIAVGNAPKYASEDVAEQAIALLLSCARQLVSSSYAAWRVERRQFKQNLPYEGPHLGLDWDWADWGSSGPAGNRARAKRHRLR